MTAKGSSEVETLSNLVPYLLVRHSLPIVGLSKVPIASYRRTDGERLSPVRQLGLALCRRRPGVYRIHA